MKPNLLRRTTALLIANLLVISQFSLMVVAQDSIPTNKMNERGPGSDEIGFSLEEVKTRSDEAAVKLVPLGDARTNALLSTWHAQVKEIPGQPGKQFATPIDGKPAPPVVASANPFTQKDQTAQPVAFLSVREALPLGETNATSTVSVHFSSQMVPLSSISQMNDKIEGVSIVPVVDGKWQWLDTETLQFISAGQRLPMATKYEVKIGTSLTAVNGAHLSDPYTWSFSTPPVANVSAPSSEIPHANFVALLFDQKVSGEAVLPFVHMRNKRGSLKIALPTEQELVREAPYVNQLRPPGAAVVIFNILDPLKFEQLIDVEILKNCPSSEGPIVSEHVIKLQCMAGPKVAVGFEKRVPFGLSGKQLTKIIYGQTFCITFNEVIADCDASKIISISPELKNQQVHIYNTQIQIQGQPIDGAHHVIHINRELKDTYQRQLANDLNIPVTYLPCTPRICNYGTGLQILQPEKSATYPIYSVNVPALHVRLYKIDQKDFLAPPVAGIGPKELVSECFLLTAGKKNHFCKTDVPLLKERNGNFLFYFRVTGCTLEEAKKAASSLHRSQVISEGPTDDLNPTSGAQAQSPSKRVNTVVSFSTWLEISNLAVSVFSGTDGVLNCWATSTETGLPESGVKVAIEPGENICAETDGNGLTKISLHTAHEFRVIATKAGTTTIVPANVTIEPAATRLQAFTDRGLYKPGEPVQIKGWVRQRATEYNADLSFVSPAPPSLKYKVVSARQKELARGEIKLESLQSFHLCVATKSDVDLGTAHVTFMLPDETVVGSTSFDIQEFRPPEFEMSLQKENSLPKYLTDAIKFTAQAKYFSSGPLSGAKVNWNFRISEGSYSPPGLESFGFQKLAYMLYAIPREHYVSARKDIVGKSDLDGADVAQAKITAYGDDSPLLVTAEASVVDLSSQIWSKRESCIIHPSRLYVGLKTNQNYVSSGQDFDFSIVVADVDGHKIPNIPVELELYKLPDDDHAHASPGAPKLISTAKFVSTEGVGSKSFKLSDIGHYGIRATVRDEKGYKNESSFLTESVDAKFHPELIKKPQINPVKAAKPSERQSLELTADKKSYKENDTAKLIGKAPYKNCIGLLTVVNNGIAQTTSMETTSGILAFSVPVLPSYIPLLHANLVVHSLDPKTDGILESSCSIDVPVSSDSRTLQLKAFSKNESLRPGESNRINFVVKKTDGTAASDANVCAIVVDESVLALNGYSLPDPVSFFYSGSSKSSSLQRSRDADAEFELAPLQRLYRADSCPPPQGSFNGSPEIASFKYFPQPYSSWMLRHHDLDLPEDIGRVEGPRDLNLFQVEPTVIDERHYISGREARHQKTSPTLPEGSPIPDNDGDGQLPAKATGKGKLRTEFGPLALFEPNLRTDATGRGSVTFTVPDSLTRYRIFVIAACGDKFFGKTESSFIVDQPVTLRPSAPRFVNIGDQFDVPFVVTNTSGKPANIEVAACAEGAVSGCAGYSLSLLANQRVSVYVHAKSIALGTGSIRGIAVADHDFQDRVAKVFPVIESPTQEAVATYGSLSRDAVNKTIEIPSPEITQDASLDLSGSASAVNELRGAASYLYAYPFSCSEQLSSQILAFSAIKMMPTELADVLASRKMVQDEQATVEALTKRQLGDGSFQLWPSSSVRMKEIPFVSIHAAHALVAAKKAGYFVEPTVLEKATTHLARLSLDQLKLDSVTKQSLLAYACYTEHLLGKDSVHRAKEILGDTKLRDIPTDVLCWLAPVLSGTEPAQCALILDRLKSTVSETASTAHFTDINQNVCDLFSCSDNRLNSLALQTLVLLDPQSSLIPKIAKGLLLGRQSGHWLNTNDDAFAFGALNEYFNLYEKESPNFALNVWFDGKHFIEQKIEHRTDKLATTSFDLTGQLNQNPALRGKPQGLVMKTDGPGRFYYRLGMKYALKEPIQKEVERGFKISRHYESVTAADDVVEQPDGSVRIKKGATVKIVTELVVPSHRYYVALVDHLPGAFESINIDLLGNSADDSFGDHARYFGSRRVDLGLTTRAVIERAFNEFRRGDFFQNLRDDRTEVFRDDLPPGYYRYAYLVRATTAGHFLAPPARIEEMYEPETFGRSDSFYVDVASAKDE